MKLQVVDAEGNTDIITVSKDSDKTASSDYSAGDIIVYTGDASNAVVTIKSEGLDNRSYNDSTKTFNNTVTTADCILFAETTSNTLGTTDAKYKVYDIRSLDSFGPVNTNYVSNSDGKVVAVFADLTGTPAGATDTTVYGIVSDANGRVQIDDNYYYQYTVASNDQTYTLNLSANDLAEGQLVYFDPVSDNIYGAGDVDKVDTGAVYVKEYSENDKTLTYFTAKAGTAGNYTGVATTQKTLALDDNCNIVYVDADKDVAGSDMGINPFDAVTGYKNAAIVTKSVDGDQVIVAVYVETSNKCNILDVADSNVLNNATNVSDIQDELANSGTAVVTGNVPAGTINAMNGENLVFSDAAINDNLLVNGGASIDGTLTVATGKDFQINQIDLGSGDELVIDVANLKAQVITMAPGAKVTFRGVGTLTATSDIRADWSTGYLNGAFDISAGVIGDTGLLGASVNNGLATFK